MVSAYQFLYSDDMTRDSANSIASVFTLLSLITSSTKLDLTRVVYSVKKEDHQVIGSSFPDAKS